MTVSPDLPRLHVITDHEVITAAGFADRARALLLGFGPRIAFHLRARQLSGRTLFDLAEDLGTSAGAVVFVNDRVDVALAAGAAGVQLRRDSLSITAARKLLGPDRRIGYSAHEAGEAVHAAETGADFLIAGTIFQSATHPGVAPAGLQLVREMARAVDVPVIAIGGIDAAKISACRASGAYGVAVIRAVWSAPEPVSAANLLLSELEA